MERWRQRKHGRADEFGRGPAPPAIPVPAAPRIPLLNRELSRLDYLRRILSEAESPDVPLLERLKFLAYTARNLDEFFMIRVGEIRDLIDSGLGERSPDGLTPQQQLDTIRENARELLTDMYDCLDGSIAPDLAAEGIVFEQIENLQPDDLAVVNSYFDRHVAPLLTPLAIDPGHPFPLLGNLVVNLAGIVETRSGESHIVLVKLPPSIPQFITLPGGQRFVSTSAVAISRLAGFFPTLELLHAVRFRLIRNTEIALHEDDVEDLRESVEAELRRIERSDVVCIEIEEGADATIVELLTRATGTAQEDVYYVSGSPRLGDLMEICERVPPQRLREQPFNPRLPQELANSDDIFTVIRRGDILLHRPYDSFSAIVDFLNSAANDPDVVAIKQTLYQTDEGSPVLEKLVAAAHHGKQVTAVIELQARFEEMKNMRWARRLEEAGVQVVFGLVGIKTHCKMSLVVRREGGELRRYVHLATGNYTVSTARTYTDLDLLTCDARFGNDVATLFNVLTGYSLANLREVFEASQARPSWKRLIVAPFDFQRWLIASIEREARFALSGREARIVAKLNSLTDPAVIAALYAASCAGVKIDLVVRSICALVPGLEGVSANIRVISVIDRFLEHSRLTYFHNGGNSEVWASSGDWMQRNFSRRVEVTWPIIHPGLRARAIDQILSLSLADNVKAWELCEDGTYIRVGPPEGSSPLRSQERFIEIARREAVSVGPYEETIAEPADVRKKAKKQKKAKDKQKASRK